MEEERQLLPAGASRCPGCGRRVTGVCPSDGPVQRRAPDSDAPPPMPPPPPVLPGYRMGALLAVGGFGAVFVAEPERGGRPVAIKVARDDRPGARRRLADERIALAAIGAPHVPALLGHGETAGGTPYLVMERLGGITLADRLRDLAEPPPLLEALDLTSAILDALAMVHACGYVHRDLKPENVFI